MECGQIPQTISQWLASALVKDGQGNVYLNLDLIQGDCSQVEPYIDCNNNHVESESHLGNVFGTDSCGNTFIRVLIPDPFAIAVGFHAQFNSRGSETASTK